MAVELNAEQVEALETVKKLGKEIEDYVANSLSIQNIGGYPIRNLAIKMNAAVQVLSPDAPVEATPVDDGFIHPNE